MNEEALPKRLLAFPFECQRANVLCSMKAMRFTRLVSSQPGIDRVYIGDVPSTPRLLSEYK